MSVVVVLGILGSPRGGGNTDLLLDAALEGARKQGAEVQKVRLNDLSIRPCQECGGCDQGGDCILNDDMVQLYRQLDEADIILLASPLFFEDLTAQTKLMIDRCQVFWVRKYRLKRRGGRKRVGALISTGARVRGDFTHAIAATRTFFLTLDVEFAEDLTFGGFEEKGSIIDHPTALMEARELGSRLVQGLKGEDGE